MKLLLQRVSSAAVSVGGEEVGRIKEGFLVLVGCRVGDSEADVQWLLGKMAALRVFEDKKGLMNLSVEDIGGSVLLVSQFTLYADTARGNRPGFSLAGDPAKAQALYDLFVRMSRERLGDAHVATGCFGAEMRVSLCNEGPVTVELCSDSKFPKALER